VSPRPSLPAALDEALEPFRTEPHDTSLLFDFDGTLAPVVDDPVRADAPAAVRKLLEGLAAHYGCVGVISGRPVTFLERRLPVDVELSGLYGLETVRGGVAIDHPVVAAWRPKVTEVVERLQAEAAPGARLDGVVVEPKGVSITLHWRTRPDLEPAAMEIAAREARRSGLEVRPAKRSAELHPPVDVDKGTAVRGLLGDRRRVLYVGDDVGDLPAFEALRSVLELGEIEHLVTVAVDGPEAPPALLAAATHRLADQGEMASLLLALVPDRPVG
jgi:trehalose 6-phosphate phosphatase